jgi:hypothetical protein
VTERASAVTYVDDEPNGLAAMLGGLIQANLDQHPERRSLLAKPATYAITAPDADVSVTIHLGPDGVKVANGVRGTPHVVVRAQSEDLIALSSVPLRFGQPDATTKEGRDVVTQLLKGQLKVKGLVTQSGRLGRLNKLLSVG